MFPILEVWTWGYIRYRINKNIQRQLLSATLSVSLSTLWHPFRSWSWATELYQNTSNALAYTGYHAYRRQCLLQPCVYGLQFSARVCRRRPTHLVLPIDGVRPIVDVEVVVTIQLQVVEAHHKALQHRLRLPVPGRQRWRTCGDSDVWRWRRAIGKV